jgi:NAD(P)-dependent dehydrogenase (short-subunit alcohol dehydrogenase family)
MDTGLSGKAVIVSGGGSNIGYGISIAFAEERANVVVADKDEVQAKRVAEQIEKSGAKALPIGCDALDYDQVTSMVQKTKEAFGRVDVLVNVVGGSGGFFIPFKDTVREGWRQDLDQNIMGFLNCTRAVLDPMIAGGGGAVGSISSHGQELGEPGMAVYNGAKAAVIAVTKTLARECGDYGLRFNTVAPGLVLPTLDEEVGELSMYGSEFARAFRATPEFKAFQEGMAQKCAIKRVGTPADVGKAVVFLASDCASYITGHTLDVSGGLVS